jgi:hypothetical protein
MQMHQRGGGVVYQKDIVIVWQLYGFYTELNI